jgi:hypothetical protein
LKRGGSGYFTRILNMTLVKDKSKTQEKCKALQLNLILNQIRGKARKVNTYNKRK